MKTRRLDFQSLERKVLLAGNVTAMLTGGDLVVLGDASKADANDKIAISLSESGKYRVTGLDGTKVNNLDTAFETAGVARNVKVDLKTGDNLVQILGVAGAAFVVPKDLTVKTLLGKDEVKIVYTTVGGKATVDVGAGNDTITVENLDAAKDVSIKTGNGVDSVSLSHSTLDGKLTVDTGNDNDSVTIDPTAVEKDLSIKTGNGDDLVVLQAVTAKGKLTVDTANGDDRVGLFETTVDQNATVTTGNDDDVVGLKGTTIKGNLRITSGNQQDAIGLAGVEVVGNATLDSGNAAAAPGAKDSVGLTGTHIGGNLDVRTGKGDDLVGAGDSALVAGTLKAALDEAFGADIVGVILAARVGIGGNASFFTGEGADQVGLFGVDVTGVAAVTTGKGEDSVSVENSNASRFKLDTGNDDDTASIVGGMADAAIVAMGSGNDVLHLNLDELPASVSLDGGAGEDTLDARGHITENSKLPGLIVQRWEHFV